MRARNSHVNAEKYSNMLTGILGKFITTPQDSIIYEGSNNTNNRVKRLLLSAMCERLDAGLRKEGWFVTGNVDTSLFSSNFTFKDPDVTLNGIDEYARGVRKLFNQQTSKAEIISTVINDTLSYTITVTWRLEGSVNIGPGLRIKPYIVYTNFRVSPQNGLIEYQEDIFSIPGKDILLNALFPFLAPWLVPPASPIEVLRQEYEEKLKKTTSRRRGWW